MATLASQEALTTVGRQNRLTKNDRLVLGALEDAGAPLKAYDLLERLKAQGIGAPMTVYRALDRLQKKGLVHKLDGLGAFMVCQHGHPHDVETFLVCRKCEKASELRDPMINLQDFAQKAQSEDGFTADLVRVEIRGLCSDCNPGA